MTVVSEQGEERIQKSSNKIATRSKVKLKHPSMWICVCAPALMTSWVVGNGFAATSYRVVELGALPGGSSIGRHMNHNGQVVGSSGVLHGNAQRAFIWTEGLGMRDLGTLPGGNYSGAFAINETGEVVGDANTAHSVRAFLWSKSAGMSDLGALPGDTASRAFGINDLGEVVGYSSGPRGVRAFIWMKESGMQSLGTLSGGNYSEAFAINNASNVVGVSNSASGKHAFLWSRAKGMTDLGTLPGDKSSQAARINNAGLVIGSSVGAPGAVHAFLWSQKSGMQDLGTLAAGQYAEAMDANNQGQVVGSSRTSLGARAFLWTNDGGMQDLNVLIPSTLDIVLSAGLRINDHGQILCMGSIYQNLAQATHELDDEHHAGPIHMFLLTPVN
jgi:probable HAF family extracellular repeat protein